MSESTNEPVAWMFQHEETGLIKCVDFQQVEWGFEKNNLRWQKIGPLYTHPQDQKKDEALRLGLEALKHYEKAGLATVKTIDAITAIEQALENK